MKRIKAKTFNLLIFVLLTTWFPSFLINTESRSLLSSAPVISNVSPDRGYNSNYTWVTITGENFTNDSNVFLGNARLRETVHLSDSQISAKIPSDLPPGKYDLSIIDEFGIQGTIVKGFEVISNSKGILADWKVTSSVNVPRCDFAAVIFDGFIYVLGGMGSTELSSIERAKIFDDGSLSSWETIGSLADPRYRFGAVVYGNNIYVIGGQSSKDLFRNVQKARINPDGTIGTWENMNGLINPRESFATIIHDNFIYVIGGEYSTYGINSVEMAEINPDGTLNPWQEVSGLNYSASSPAGSMVGEFIFSIGNNIYGRVESTTMNLGGMLKPWAIGNSANLKNSGPSTVISTGFLYAIGGHKDGAITSEINTSELFPDGTNDQWKNVSGLKIPRFDHSSVTHAGHIYAIGGHNGQIQLSSVEYSTVILNYSNYLPLVYK